MGPEKGKKVDMAAALSDVNRYHLMFAGYSMADIAGFGDLSKLDRDRMRDLIRTKVMEEAAKRFKKSGVRTRSLQEDDET